MDGEKLIRRLLYIVIILLAMNFLANKFYWYSAIWWLDIIMHFVGGLWIGLLYIWIFRYKLKNSVQGGDFSSHIFKILFFVLVMGIAWEVFQGVVNDTLAKNPFDRNDVIIDLISDLAGGAFAVFYFLKRIMFNTETKV